MAAWRCLPATTCTMRCARKMAHSSLRAKGCCRASPRSGARYRVRPAGRGMRTVLGVIGGLTVALSIGAVRAPLSLKDVMRRVGAYVDAYGDKASIVVCTERYEQHAQTSFAKNEETRTLTSDFALVYADAIHGWLGFRDVIDVDGRAGRDRG